MPRYLFVTGKLAAQSLRDTLENLSPNFEYEDRHPSNFGCRVDGHPVCSKTPDK